MEERNEGGSIAPLVALLVLGVVGLTSLLSTAAGHIDTAARAQTAADAVALAAVTGGRSAATHVAEANGADVEVLVIEGDEAEAKVRIGRHVAVARAAAGSYR